MGFELGTFVRSGILSTTSDHASVVSINLFIALLCACIVIGHLLEETKWMNESITALILVSLSQIMILKFPISEKIWNAWLFSFPSSSSYHFFWFQGLCTGVVILLTTKGKSSHILVFSEDLFFIYLLPPIIFNAGWVGIFLNSQVYLQIALSFV